jgi:PPE-repeat protein
MIEPPARGFTGVVWEARPAEKLAKDLATGTGTAPLADAAAAWTRLGTQFGSALVDYDHILTTLRQAWRSDHSTSSLERIAVLRQWLQDAAVAAAANAARTADHIVAYEVAGLAMPHPDEVAALAEAQRVIAQLGAALGAPMIAAADDAEQQQTLAKAHAARVMRTYETATEPLAAPWAQEPPPVVVPDSALRAEQATHTDTPTATVPRPVATGFPRMPAIPVVRELSSYRATSVAQAGTVPQYSPTATATTPADSGAGRIAPGSMAPTTTGAADGERSSRAGDATQYRADPTDIADPIQAAPAVLGVTDQPADTARPPLPGEAS